MHERRRLSCWVVLLVCCSNASKAPPGPTSQVDLDAGGGGPSLLTDTGTPNVPSDAGRESAQSNGGATPLGTSDAGPLAVAEGCPTIHAEPYPGQPWAIVAIDFENDEVVFQNVSGVTQLLNNDPQWCSFAIYNRLLPLGPDFESTEREFAPGEVGRISTLIGTRTKFLPSDGEEMALYSGPGTYRDPTAIWAFVSWGTGAPVDGREDIAAAAMIWPFGERVPTTRQTAGIVAVGRTDRAAGFVAVSARCLP